VRCGHTGDAALERLTQLFSAMEKCAWKCSPETDEQREWVRAWTETTEPHDD
jgi:hypothetical protein